MHENISTKTEDRRRTRREEVKERERREEGVQSECLPYSICIANPRT